MNDATEPLGSTGAEMLRRERGTRGLSQEQLASLSGLAVRTIRGLEGGHVDCPHRTTLDRICSALGLTDERRDRFAAAWVPAGRPADAPTSSPPVWNDLPPIARDQVDCTYSAYLQHVAHVERGLGVVRERTEQVTVAAGGRVEAVPVAMDGLGRGVTSRLGGFEGCHVEPAPAALDDTLRVLDVRLGRTLRPGEAGLHSFEQHHQATSEGEVGQDEEDPWAGRRVRVGLLQPSGLVIVKVVFAHGETPRRCVRLLQRRLELACEATCALPVSDGGSASLVVLEPCLGWHGIGWEW